MQRNRIQMNSLIKILPALFIYNALIKNKLQCSLLQKCMTFVRRNIYEIYFVVMWRYTVNTSTHILKMKNLSSSHFPQFWHRENTRKEIRGSNRNADVTNNYAQKITTVILISEMKTHNKYRNWQQRCYSNK